MPALFRLSGPVDCEPQRWQSPGHFHAAAAEAMRRFLVEQARHTGRLRYGGARKRVDLDSACAVVQARSMELLKLDVAPTKLATNQPRLQRCLST